MKVKKLRLERGLKQTELAEMLETNQGYISLLERGKFTPSLRVLKKLSDIFGVTIDDLIEEDDVKHTKIQNDCKRFHY